MKSETGFRTKICDTPPREKGCLYQCMRPPAGRCKESADAVSVCGFVPEIFSDREKVKGILTKDGGFSGAVQAGFMA